MDSESPSLNTRSRRKRSALELEGEGEGEAGTSPPRKKRARKASQALVVSKKRRKRKPWTSPKKSRNVAKSEDIVDTENNLYSVWDILCETESDGYKYFLVVWNGVDQTTSEPWPDSWCGSWNFGENNSLLAGWELKQAAIEGASGPKARENAARRTIHSYLWESGESTREFEEAGIEHSEPKDSGIDSCEFNENLAYKQHSRSVLAQDSVAFNSSGLTTTKFPIVRPYRQRTLSSSSSASQLSSATASLSSKKQVANTSASADSPRLTESQIETALPYTSPPRHQIIRLRLPGPPSNPDEYKVVTASQLQSSQLSITQAGETDFEADQSSQVLTANSSEENQPTRSVPDSQSITSNLLQTQQTSDPSHDDLNGLNTNVTALEIGLQKRSGERDSSRKSPDRVKESAPNSGVNQFEDFPPKETETVSNNGSLIYDSPTSVSSANSPAAPSPVIESAGLGSQSGSLKESSLIRSEFDSDRPADSIESQGVSQFTDADSAFVSQVHYTHSQPPIRNESSLLSQPVHKASQHSTGIGAKPATQSLSSSEMSEERGVMSIDEFLQKKGEIWGTSSQISTSRGETSSLVAASTYQTQPASTSDISAILSSLGQGGHEGDLDIYLALSLEEDAQFVYKSIFRMDEGLLDSLQQSFAVVGDQTSASLARAKKQLFDACFHTDLIADAEPGTQLSATVATQVAWSSQSSSKCSFLKQFLLGVSDVDKHIVIYAKSADYLDILEKFFRGINVAFSRPEALTDLEKPDQELRVTLMRTGSGVKIRPADLVIGVDESLDPKSEEIMNIRRDLDDKICPSICLVVHHSIEHILRDSLLNDRKASKISENELLLRAQKYHGMVGYPNAESSTAAALGRKLAYVFVSQPAHEWTLPSVFDIKLSNDVKSEESNRAPDTVTPRDQFRDVDKPNSMLSSRKRSLEGSTSLSDIPQKRVRRSPEVLEGDARSTTAQIQPIRSEKSTPPRTGNADIIVAHTSSAGVGQGADLVRTRDALLADISAKESSRRDLEIEADKLQTRFEEQSKVNHSLRTELINQQASVSNANIRIGKLTASNSELRSERAALQAEMASLRDSLRGSDDSTTRKMAELGEKAARVEALEKRADASKQELEYIRQNYQQASAAAKELAEENATLRQENEELKRKASEESTKLRAMVASASTSRMKDQMRMFEAEKEHLQRALQNAQEENLRLKQWKEQEERRAGMSISTRSSSLPVQDATTEGHVGRALHDARTQRNLGSSSKGGARGTMSANVSRAASPAFGQTGRGPPKTSPLQNAVSAADQK